MGIPGLAKFFEDRNDRFLKPFELQNTYLVIDGNNLASQIYRWQMISLSAFGGDYDEYDNLIRQFFINLEKCNVKPIVIYDGGYEKKKLPTIKKRTKERMAMLKEFNRRCWTGLFFPLLMIEVMYSVLESLGVTQVQCFFEADKEIAAVARHLNCPVLSYDSDFYVFGVLYIPFNTICSVLRESPSGNYIECAIFDVEVFLLEFEGLKREMLPLMAALLGNDYVDNRLFDKFLNHITLPSNSHGTYTQRRICGVIHWLKTEMLDSAIENILSHINKNSTDEALKAIKATIEDYKMREPVILPLLKLENSEAIEKPLLYEDHELIKKLPERLVQLYQSCKILPNIIDIIHLNHFYLKIQVEDVTKPSSQELSFPIISAIHKIMSSFTGESSVLTIHFKKFNYYTNQILTCSVDHCFGGMNIKNIMSESREDKMRVLLNVLSFTADDINATENFDNNWVIFVICFIFWFKNRCSNMSSAHFHSIFLMAIANYVQTRVGGHFKNYKRFMECKAGLMNRLSKTEIIETNQLTNNKFSVYLNSLTQFEFLGFHSKFMKLRKNEPEVTSKGYFIATIHMFAEFQSVLAHFRQLNALIDFPFPDIKFSEFYSGTLLYNLYYMLNKKTNIVSFVIDLLNDMPNMKNLYQHLMQVLGMYIPSQRLPEKATRLCKTPHKRKTRWNN